MIGRAIAAPAAVATVAGMIAFPLAARRSLARRRISDLVVGGLAVVTTANAASRWGGARTAGAAMLVAVGTGAVERIGTSTGWPFGPYRYTDRLRPQLAGVPVIVPAAWWAMALPAREVAHAVLGRQSSRVGRMTVGAVALTAWDLFLDPQMVGEGYWRWASGGRYRGIPMTNYAGWLVTAGAVMALLELVLPPERPDPALVAEYVGMAVMETVGFAAFFGDRVVAAVGGAAMLPLAALAVVRKRHG